MTFEFIADRPALDFVATVAERGSTDLELLQTPADLAAWVRQSHLVDDDLALDEADLRRAKIVREALFCLIRALIDWAPLPLPVRDLEVVNTAASGSRPRLHLDPGGAVRRSGDLDTVLAVLATDVVDLFGSPDRDVLRWCDDAACTRPFVDRSRGQRRRWCGMQGCGDRAKAAAYRQRRRAART